MLSNNAAIFVTVRDRPICTAQFFDTLLPTLREGDKVFCYDMGSSHETRKLLCSYESSIFSITYFPSPSVYWSKNLAWAFFVKSFPVLKSLGINVIVHADNDVEFRPGWLDASIAALHHPIAKRERIAVIDPYNAPKKFKLYRRGHLLQLGKTAILSRAGSLSRCWVSGLSVWQQWDPPTWDTIKRFNDDDREPTDAYYWPLFASKGYRWGAFVNPLVFDCAIPCEGSARIHANIGADARKKDAL